ncbi:MAG: phosphoglycolate phosphatase [Magnetococcales bacterium]|nr:phosphoglycolate phosphatase [Magnetococcales bacterium]
MNGAISCRALLFDLDGTLVDSAQDLWRTLNHLLAAKGLERVPLERVRHLVGHGARALLARGVHGEKAVPPSHDPEFETDVQQFLAYYQDHLTDHTRPFPGVPETLRALAGQGFSMAVVTNKIESFSRTILEQLGLAELFPVVVGGDTLPWRKPDPQPLLHALEQLGVPPGEGVMIGDSETDFQAARNARLPVILCSWGYNRGEDVGALHPDHVVDRFGQLPGFLYLSRETRITSS